MVPNHKSSLSCKWRGVESSGLHVSESCVGAASFVLSTSSVLAQYAYDADTGLCQGQPAILGRYGVRLQLHRRCRLRSIFLRQILPPNHLLSCRNRSNFSAYYEWASSYNDDHISDCALDA